MNFLAKKLENNKLFNSKPKITFDPKRATSYRYGATGQISSDCKVKTKETKKIDKVANRAKKYMKKYI